MGGHQKDICKCFCSWIKEWSNKVIRVILMKDYSITTICQF